MVEKYSEEGLVFGRFEQFTFAGKAVPDLALSVIQNNVNNSIDNFVSILLILFQKLRYLVADLINC